MKVLAFALSLVATVCSSHYCTPPASGSAYPGDLAYTTPTQTYNHVYIGGMFSEREADGHYGSCGPYKALGIQETEAFFWALRTVKSRYPTQLLKNVDLAGFAWDFCDSSRQAVTYPTTFGQCLSSYGMPPIQPKMTMGFVDALYSSQALVTTPYLGWLANTAISSSATSTELNPSVDKYKYFLRTVPSDDKQAEALVAIVKLMGWKYIQVVHAPSAYGQSGSANIKKHATENDICVVQTVSLPEDVKDASEMDEVVDKLLERRRTRAVFVVANEGEVNNFLKAVKRKGAKNDFTWLAPDGWGNLEAAVKGVEREAQGAVTLSIASPSYARQPEDDFFAWYKTLRPEQNMWNPAFKQFWMQKFQCKLAGLDSKFTVPCNTSVHSLHDETMSQYIGSVIAAVDALVHGIDSTIKNECPNTEFVCTNLINDPKHRDIIYNRVRSAVISPGNVKFFDNSTGETWSSRLRIYNYRRPTGNSPTYSYHEVGYYKSDGPTSSFEKFLPTELYAYDDRDDKISVPNSVCEGVCYDCNYIFPVTTTTAPTTTTTTPATTTTTPPPTVPTPRPNVGGLRYGVPIWAIVLLVLSGIGIVIALVFEFYIMSRLIGTPLAQFRTMWLGQVLLFAIILCYLVCIAYAFEPTEATCGITRFGTGVVYALCFSVLVVKAILILSSKTEGYLRGLYQLLLLLFAWLVQIVIDAEWMILVPPKANYDVTRELYVCNHTFESHVISLVYVMFLIAVATISAVRTHGIITNHREGIFVGIAAGFSIPLWLAWTLTGAFHWNVEFEVPVIAYGLFLNATLILFAMFLPKVRQLNTMGVEGVYLEDDVPEDVYGGSVVYAPPSYKSKHDSIYINGGSPGVYDVPYTHDPRSLYLKHPGSVRSAPPVHHLRTTRLSTHQPTRVLTVTNDLAGKNMSLRPVRAHSEMGYKEAIRNSDANSRHSSRLGTLKKSGSASELGAL